MKIASANLNQRIGNSGSRRAFETWLHIHGPDVVLAQEPFNPNREARPELAGYELISTSALISAWAKAPMVSDVHTVQHSDRWHELRVHGLSVHNVYLSPHSAKERRELLERIAAELEPNTRSILLGDFNLAPRSADGRFGEEASGFTSSAERRALQGLISSANLVDATSGPEDAEPAFTFERTQQGQRIRFRCDLALVSEGLLPSASIAYDHSVRVGKSAFTDHSAILVSLPDISASTAEVSKAETAVARPVEPPADTLTISPGDAHKTAIRRREASQIARALSEQDFLDRLGVQSILDVGCAYGEDVRFYQSSGLDAEGYDPEPRFGFNNQPARQFDLVTLVFVVNVLPSAQDRLDAVVGASRFVRPDGLLLIAARSESAITAEAKRGNWPRHNDGWISSTSKGTFQKGVGPAELGWLLGGAGLSIVECGLHLSRDVSWIVGAKRAAR